MGGASALLDDRSFEDEARAARRRICLDPGGRRQWRWWRQPGTIERRRSDMARGRLHQIRRDQDDELGLVATIALRREQEAEHRHLAEHREFTDVLGDRPLKQPGERKRLAARYLDDRVGA